MRSISDNDCSCSFCCRFTQANERIDSFVPKYFLFLSTRNESNERWPNRLPNRVCFSDSFLSVNLAFSSLSFSLASFLFSVVYYHIPFFRSHSSFTFHSRTFVRLCAFPPSLQLCSFNRQRCPVVIPTLGPLIASDSR